MKAKASKLDAKDLLEIAKMKNLDSETVLGITASLHTGGSSSSGSASSGTHTPVSGVTGELMSGPVDAGNPGMAERERPGPTSDHERDGGIVDPTVAHEGLAATGGDGDTDM